MNNSDITLAKVTLTLTTLSDTSIFMNFKIFLFKISSFWKISEHIRANLLIVSKNQLYSFTIVYSDNLWNSQKLQLF